MADFNSSLPVRTENPGDVQSRISDGTTPSQYLGVDSSGRITVKLDDGSGNLITSQANGAQRALDVGINVGGVQIDPRAIRALTAADVVTVQQGTSPWITKDLSDGAVSGGVAGTFSLLSGLIYNSSALTLTTGQQSSLQGDVNGYLKVNIAAGSLDVGVADKTAFTYGTSVFQPVGGVYQDTSPALTAGQSGAARLTANRAVHTNLRTSAGIEITAQANGSQEALDVGINVAGVQVDPRSIRALTAADVVTANQGTAGTAAQGWFSKITDGTNVAAVKAASTAAAATDPSLVVALSPNSPVPTGNNIIGQVKLTDGTSIVGVAPASTAATTTQPAEVVALSPNTPLPAGTNAIGSVLANLQVANAAVTTGNPVPVTVVSSVPGTAVQYYQTSAAVAAGSSATFTYTVATGHTFNLQRVWASGSGKIKVVVQNGSNTIFVGFNSTANPNLDITVMEPPLIAAAGTVNVIVTNDDKAAFDLYCTIEGNQN